jgi:ribonuclease HI
VEGITGEYWDNRKKKNCAFRDPEKVKALWNKLEEIASQ